MPKQRRQRAPPPLEEPRLLGQLGEALEREVIELEQSLAGSESERLRLADELKEALERCAELEELAARQLGQSFDQAAVAEQAQTWTEELQRRLAHATAEAEDLRRQLFASAQVAQQASAEAASVRAAATGQEAELKRQLFELSRDTERLQLERDRLEDEVSELRRLRRLDSDGGEDKRRKGRRDSKVGEKDEVREREEGGGSAKEEQRQSQGFEASREAHVQREQQAELQREQLAELQGRMLEKEHRIEGLAGLVQHLLELVSKLQDSHVKQTTEYMRLSKQLRSLQQKYLQGFGGSEGDAVAAGARKLRATLHGLHGCGRMWRGECEQLEAHYHSLAQNHRLAVESVQGHQEALRSHQEAVRCRHEGRAARCKHLHQRNLSQQVASALDGAYIQKINRSGKLQERLVKISMLEEDCNQMQLQWAKPPFKTFAKSSALDLSRVILIGYGYMARAWALFEDVLPERCFSVHTIRRSFDFVCDSEDEAESFVLALSRLCVSIQGWHVPGSIQSHAKFVCARGWSKLEAGCRKRQVPMAKRFLEAIAKAHIRSVNATARQSGSPSSTQLARSGAEAGFPGMASARRIPGGPPELSPFASPSSAVSPFGITTPSRLAQVPPFPAESAAASAIQHPLQRPPESTGAASEARPRPHSLAAPTADAELERRRLPSLPPEVEAAAAASIASRASRKLPAAPAQSSTAAVTTQGQEQEPPQTPESGEEAPDAEAQLRALQRLPSGSAEAAALQQQEREEEPVEPSTPEQHKPGSPSRSGSGTAVVKQPSGSTDGGGTYWQ